MNPKLPYIISLVAYLCGANLVLAASEEAQPNCDQTTNLNLKTNDIFDLTDPDTIFLHHWANLLHIKTKDITLINESAFFIQKCDIAQADIDELERHLRKQKYIREAKVTVNDDNKVDVETWDNWSLMPTVDFGRKGGINKYAIGVSGQLK